jgi:predicted nucleic acid-binding protein
MARPLVLDTTVMIDVLRRPQRLPALTRAFRPRRLWLTSVTVAELYAGTRSAEEARWLDHVAGTFARAQRLLTPTAEEWRQAGQLISRAIRHYGAIEPRAHLADVLVVVAAARVHGAVATANQRHFECWVELAARADLDVVLATGNVL